MRGLALTAVLACGFASVPMAAHAAAPATAPVARDLGTFGKWTASVDLEGGKPVCYMSTIASKSDGTYKARGPVMLTVTHRPSRKEFDTVSIVAGYQYKVDSDVAVTVDKQTWSFFSKSDRAWARDTATDKAVTKAVIAGNTLVTKGTSIRGTPTTDTFALTGAGKAYKVITDACK